MNLTDPERDLLLRLRDNVTAAAKYLPRALPSTVLPANGSSYPDRVAALLDRIVEETKPEKSSVRSWIQTSTGRKFYPFEPRAEDLDIHDIARGLAMTCRYGGQTNRSFYSVAEHCVLVSRHVDPKYAREGLLHDSAEAYIGDMPRPIKHQPKMVEFRRAEAEIEKYVAEKFGLRTDSEALAAVKEIDDRILLDEMRALMHSPELYLEPGGWTDGLAPTGAEIMGYSPERAEVLFLARFYELFEEHRPPGFTGDFEIL